MPPRGTNNTIYKPTLPNHDLSPSTQRCQKPLQAGTLGNKGKSSMTQNLFSTPRGRCSLQAAAWMPS